jgi:hypothetical protein
MTTFTVFAIFRIVQVQGRNVKEDSPDSASSVVARRTSSPSLERRSSAGIMNPQMAEHGSRYFHRSFTMREMTNTIEHDAVIATCEEAVQPCDDCGSSQESAAPCTIRAGQGSVLVSRRRRSSGSYRGSYTSPARNRAVSVQGDRNPVGISETLGRRGELCLIEPARRAPGIPLDPAKRSSPSASARSTMSCASASASASPCPVLGMSADRNRVGPNPRR